MVQEIWKAMPKFSYEVSNMGRVRRVWKSHKTVLKPWPDRDGYLQITLCKGGKKFKRPLHKLVMMLFVGPVPKGYEVNHKDGNKRNAKQTNLEYLTKSENTKHAIALGLIGSGETHPMAKLNNKDIRVIKHRLKAGENYGPIARDFGVSNTNIGDINRGRIWSHIKI